MRSRLSRRRAGQLLFAAALVVISYRFGMAIRGWPPHRLYMGLDTHCDGLLIGCALAFWLPRVPSIRHERLRFGAAAAAVGALGVTSISARSMNDLASPSRSL